MGRQTFDGDRHLNKTHSFIQSFIHPSIHLFIHSMMMIETDDNIKETVFLWSIEQELKLVRN